MAIYGTTSTPTNSFTNNTKVQCIASNVADGRLFTKASVSKMSQADFARKKYGQSYTLYIPGKPKLENGVVAKPSNVVEIPTEVFIDNDNVSEELGPFQRLGDLESFDEQIGQPMAEILVRGQEKKIINKEIFKAAHGIVAAKTSESFDGASFDVLGKATAKLRKLALGEKLTGFLDPDVNSTIIGKGLNKFQAPSDDFKRLYGEAAIGKFGTAKWVESPDLPTLHIGSAYTGTITLGSAKLDTDNTPLGFAEIKEITGENLVPGAMFKVQNDKLKIVDESGIETQVPFHIIVLEVYEDDEHVQHGKISPIRISFPGQGYNNPNAWVPAGTESLTLVAALSANTDYVIGDVRSESCLAYDTYQFDAMPGSDDEFVSTVGGSSVRVKIWGDGTNLNKLYRIDSTYAAALFEPRENVVIYTEV